jgi:hypothetical protein
VSSQYLRHLSAPPRAPASRRRAIPAAVLAPVESPPWSSQRPLRGLSQRWFHTGGGSHGAPPFGSIFLQRTLERFLRLDELVSIGATAAHGRGLGNPAQRHATSVCAIRLRRPKSLASVNNTPAHPGEIVATGCDAGFSDAPAVLRAVREAAAFDDAAQQCVHTLPSRAANAAWTVGRWHLALVPADAAVVGVRRSVAAARAAGTGASSRSCPSAGRWSGSNRARGTSASTGRAHACTAGSSCACAFHACTRRARQSGVARTIAVAGAPFAPTRTVPRSAALAATRSCESKCSGDADKQSPEKLTQTLGAHGASVPSLRKTLEGIRLTRPLGGGSTMKRNTRN